MACGGGGGSASVDADPSAPDADPSAPDADPSAPDAGSQACGTPAASPEARATIGAAGGTLTVGAATVTIPAGALATDLELVLTPTIIEVTAAKRALTAVYALTPEGVSFAVPVTLTVDTGSVLPSPDDVALYTSETAGGPFVQASATRSGSTYTLQLENTGFAYAARISPAPATTPTSCSVLTLNPAGGVLFSLVPQGGNYYRMHARHGATGPVFIGSYMKDALWNLFAHAYSATGVAATPINFTGNTSAAIMGGTTVASTDGTIITAYDSNKEQGSELWVARRNADGTAVGTAVRVSQDPGIYSERPALVATANGGAFVVWRALNPVGNLVYLRAAALDASLTVTKIFDLTEPADGIPLGERGAADFTAVGDGSTIGVVWSWADNNGAAGVRYQAFDAQGCALTEVIEVAAGLFTPVLVSATLAADQVVVAYSRASALDGASTRVRVIDLDTGLLGAVRLYGLELDHTGIVANQEGFFLAGASGLNQSAMRLTRELDRAEQPFIIGGTSAQDTVAGVSSNPAGTLLGAAWVSVGQMVEGRVSVVSCP